MYAYRHFQTSGYSSNRVDMVFMGDGYTAPEINTTYTPQIQGFLSYMFNGSLLSEPFGRYRNFFNIHSIDVVSNESGADDLAYGISRDTALDASYSGRLLNVSLSKADEIEEDVLPYGVSSDMRFILVNDESYGGAGYDSGIYSAGNPQAYEIALHEIGHAFVGLGDEYDYGADGSYAGPDPAYANVATDPDGAKWARWLGYDQPGIGVIGAYEGAYYHATGIYRPSLNSKMKTLGQPFDAISREQFVRKFYEFVDPLDGYTDPWGTKHNLTDFYVDTVDPAVILVDWTVDGVTTVNAGETFRITKDYYGFGTHTVTARAYDPTDWVRGDRSALEQRVSWTVVNDYLLTGGGAADGLEGNEKANEIQGRGGRDTLDGGLGDDRMLGGDDDDLLRGGNGADSLDGDAGADIMDGGAGNDTFYVDNRSDKVAEASRGGTDTILTSVSFTLGSTSEVEALTMQAGTTGLSLTGNKYANALTGNAGANKLYGGLGNDLLRGGAGKDIFVFNTKANKTTNVDRILDFSSPSDGIWLDNKYFTKLGRGSSSGVKFKSDMFVEASKARDAEDRIVYDKKSGALCYDADGIGRTAQVKIATISNKAKLYYHDFFVV